MELILRLFFHGLIALVPATADGAGTMTAYAVNHPQHKPTLAFEMSGRMMCPQDQRQGRAVCTLSGSWCSCNLNGFTMSFRQRTLGAGRRIEDRRGNPAGEGDAADPAWLVRLHSVNQGTVKVDPQKLPGATVSHITFDWISMRSCHLDQVDNDLCIPTPAEGCNFAIHPARFVTLSGEGSHEQAVSEYLMFELRFLSVSGGVTLVLSDPTGSIEIDLECDGHSCPDLLVGNMASTLTKGDEENRHFLAYYDLAEDGVTRYFPQRRETPFLSVGNRQLHNCSGDPFRRRLGIINLRLQEASEREKFLAICSQKDKESSWEDLDCGIYKAAQSRIICPSAMFDP